MEEEVKNQGSGLAVGALVTGIIAFLMAVIPCVGVIAVVPAIIAVVLGVVGLSRARGSNGMLIGGLVIGIIALMISVSQTFVISKMAKHSDNWGSQIEEAIKDISTDITDEFDGNNFSIKIKSEDDSVEIKGHSSRKDLEQKLDELESQTDSASASIKIDIN